MSSIYIRHSLDEAVNELMHLAGQGVSEQVKLKLRRAYQYLQIELAQIDQAILDALEQEAA